MDSLSNILDPDGTVGGLMEPGELRKPDSDEHEDQIKRVIIFRAASVAATWMNEPRMSKAMHDYLWTGDMPTEEWIYVQAFLREIEKHIEVRSAEAQRNQAEAEAAGRYAAGGEETPPIKH